MQYTGGGGGQVANQYKELGKDTLCVFEREIKKERESVVFKYTEVAN